VVILRVFQKDQMIKNLHFLVDYSKARDPCLPLLTKTRTRCQN